MLNYRLLIAKNLTWDIGLGRDALFWEDEWDGLPSPDSANLPINIKTLSSSWGKNVSDYKIKINDNQYGGWQWKTLDETPLSSQEKCISNQFLKSRQTNHKERKNKLIWGASKDGNYKVKLGYEKIINSQQWNTIDIPLNLCWDPTCLPKVGIFLWAALQ